MQQGLKKYFAAPASWDLYDRCTLLVRSFVVKPMLLEFCACFNTLIVNLAEHSMLTRLFMLVSIVAF